MQQSVSVSLSLLLGDCLCVFVMVYILLSSVIVTVSGKSVHYSIILSPKSLPVNVFMITVNWLRNTVLLK